MPRPLSPQIDDALMASALELLARDGFARLSIASVAAAAGVGKPPVPTRAPPGGPATSRPGGS